MPSLKDIRKRISSVKSTQKMARAMKMVSAAKLRRAQDSAVRFKPYADRTERILQHLLAGLEFQRAELGKKIDHPFLLPAGEETHSFKKIALVVLTSDRGMCGGFNSNLLRFAEEMISERKAKGVEVDVFSLGVHTRTFCARKQIPITEDLGLFAECDWTNLAKKLRDAFMSGRFDAVALCYNQFVSAMTQKPTLVRLLPLAREAVASRLSIESTSITEIGLGEFQEPKDLPQLSLAEQDLLCEPSFKPLLDAFLPRVFDVRIQQALMESSAGEHAARMNAMGAATDNAAKMIAQLTLQLNRARQAAITTELVEIISGAEALK